MTEHAHKRGHGYEVVMNGDNVVWHGTDHTHAENSFKRYVARTRVKGGEYEGQIVELHHDGKPIKFRMPEESSIKVYSEGTVC